MIFLLICLIPAPPLIILGIVKYAVRYYRGKKMVKIAYNNVTQITNNKILIDDRCCICLDDLKSTVIKLDCGHFYHTRCINDWTYENIQSKCKSESPCPLCHRIYCTIQI